MLVPTRPAPPGVGVFAQRSSGAGRVAYVKKGSGLCVSRFVPGAPGKQRRLGERLREGVAPLSAAAGAPGYSCHRSVLRSVPRAPRGWRSGTPPLSAGALSPRRAPSTRWTRSLLRWLLQYWQRTRSGPSGWPSTTRGCSGATVGRRGSSARRSAGASRGLALVAVRRAHVRAHAAEIERKGLAPSTRHSVAAVLLRGFADALDDDLIGVDPTIRKPGRQSSTATRARPRFTVWTRDELLAFLEAVEGDRLEALWRVAVATGARRGELLGLAWFGYSAATRTRRLAHTARPRASARAACTICATRRRRTFSQAVFRCMWSARGSATQARS